MERSNIRTLSPRVNKRRVFVAAPMSGYGSDDEYRATRSTVMELLAALEATHSYDSVYFAGTNVASAMAFNSHDIALHVDLRSLRQSDVFVLVYPRQVLSSVLVEAGYAMALGIPMVLFVRRRGDLPYLFQEAEKLTGTQLVPPLSIYECGVGPDMISLAHAAITKVCPPDR